MTKLFLLLTIFLLTLMGCKGFEASGPSNPSPTAAILGPQSPNQPTATKHQPSTPTHARPTPTQTQKSTKKATAPNFVLQDLEGNQVALSDFQGKKVLLNFWASWCGPCRAEIPHMVKLYNELEGEGFEIVAVNIGEDPSKVRKFVQEYRMPFPVLLDRTGQVGRMYAVRGIPTSYFIDEKGFILGRHVGTLSDALLRQYVSQLMQSPQGAQ